MSFLPAGRRRRWRTKTTCALRRCRKDPGRSPLSPSGLAADQGDRDVPHRRVGLGAVPMALPGLDMRDIADIDLAPFVLGCHDAGARGHDQHLVAIVGMPSSGATLAEVHHAAVIVCGIPGLDDGLTGPSNGPRPPFDPLGSAFGRDVWYVFQRDYLHDDP